ncbi:cytochrome P450 [Rhizophagus irregularis]|uniref:Cytochrome P450 n=4 Tax=Rhizophagus irregularis TaxID=588596 RepID=A0A2I1ELU1_9GLOM|nr:cytochrome P450 [Rhizophagus irregularis DAOM 181602=DAOM 197198]EXX65300.1 sterol 14-demethylase [Rhizophagus irregularis DAOM 197198w]PKC13459.1 cytochrome P450 [Rhizophagus irregularis]PKC69053.1 cytochrome P450 [Rhizophagus irregularis]PKY23088.1 cytochrome P450 [Rhizophagus irregularis]POG73771.1 cytochrome P450 [Rhizophagus irregularis DAOM 181602=DAOM 197198]|eukprot:XP_025180637.1 cytochrome P450 [Rhizophagus irregularis DAOM 181602=DAOM 197198]
MLDSFSLISFFVLGVIGWITYKIFIWPFYISPLRKISGPPSKGPFYGNLKAFLADDFNSGVKWFKEYGYIIKFHGIFNKPSLFIADPKIIQEIILNKNYDFIKPYNTSAIAIAGKGLLFSEGEDHKRQRKMMSPAFTHNNIKEMIPTFIRITSTLKGLIEDEINQGKSNINFTPYISKTTLDIIGSVGFNYEFNSLTSSNELAEAYDSILNSPPTVLRMTISLLANYVPLIREIPVDINRKFKNACAVINRVSKQLIEEKYNEAKNGELKSKDLLSVLININKTLPVEEKITDEELKYQIMTFLIAGHETTNVTACWALYLLSEHPYVQDLLREELVKAFPDKSNFNPTFDDINSLEYLNCVIKESLRLHSPVPILKRANSKDKVFGEHLIPKDTELFIGISALHKSPEIWGSTVDDFDPKRWLDPSLNVTNLNYLPFLNGPRGCIGNKLALTEMKIMLGMLIRNFVFQPIEGFHISRKIFPSPKPYPYLGLAVSIVES